MNRVNEKRNGRFYPFLIQYQLTIYFILTLALSAGIAMFPISALQFILEFFACHITQKRYGKHHCQIHFVHKKFYVPAFLAHTRQYCCT